RPRRAARRGCGDTFVRRPGRRCRRAILAGRPRRDHDQATCCRRRTGKRDGDGLACDEKLLRNPVCLPAYAQRFALFVGLCRQGADMAVDPARMRATDRLQQRLADVGTSLDAAFQAARSAAGEGSTLEPAAEWLLDHFYVIKEQIKEIRAGLPRGYWNKLPTCTAP